jgi:methyltransferase (TIGR00027 family)
MNQSGTAAGRSSSGALARVRRASRTAEYMALFRALESVVRPRRARLFEDPYARAFLRPSLRAVVAAAALPGLGGLLRRLLDERWPGARSSGVARTRWIDDAVRAACRDALRQIVIVGAGFDCRALRLPELAAARIFEIDHPATIAAKRRGLARRLAALPAGICFVPGDLEKASIDDLLVGAGFDHNTPAFFLWEGVTNYLSEAAVDATLTGIARVAAPGSRLIFTYVHRGVIDGSASFPGTAHLAATLQRAGEPWTFGLDPAAVPEFLAARGFSLLEDLGAADYRMRYTPESPGRGYEFYRVALAIVGGEEMAACRR